MNKTVGKKIREYREAKGISQEDLAERLQISRSTYQRIENGDTNSWINYLEKISKELEVSPNEFLKGDESFVQVNHENTSETQANDNNTVGNVVQHQTINYNLPDKLIEQYETRISEYKEEITALKERIKNLEAGF